MFAAVAVAVALGANLLRLSGPAQPETSAESAAQQGCESDARNQLAAPEGARFSQVRTEAGSLDLDGRDLAAVTTEEPLKSVAPSRITVLAVSGVVESRADAGNTIQNHVNCRAYFLDGTLVRTQVVLSEVR